jgi:hypothetical protein
MKYFLGELRIVPKLVWLIALLTTGVMVALFLRMPRVAPLGWVETIFIVQFHLMFFAWVVLIGYIYADARRRGMRYIMWTLLSIFLLYFIGPILYFVLRDPLLIHCPKCSIRCRSTYVFCPGCGTELLPSCPSCKRAVEPHWNRCVYCGKELLEETVQR